jgi:TolB-like protein
VLYFDDRSPETLPSYIVDGITEGLIDQLTGVRALHVISPTGVRGYRGAVPPLDSLRRALKVGTIVSGSVARSGATVRATVRLTDVATGLELSNATIETEWTERFVLEDRIADQVDFALRRRIGAEIDMRERRAGTRSIEAWEAAQRANDAVRREAELVVSVRGESKRLYYEADSLYLRALQLDPQWNYARIKRGIMALRLWYHPDPPISAEDRNVPADLPAPARRALWNAKAIRLANEVLERDRRSAEALSLRGAARYGLMVATPRGDTLAPVIEADLRAALAIRPDDASAWITLSFLQSERAKFLDAAASAEHAFEADPFFQQRQVIYTAFWAYLWSERFAEADRWCKMGVTHYPTAPLFAECELTLVGWTGKSAADAAVAWGMIDRLERGSAADPLRQTWGYRRLLVAAVLARAGMADSARHLLDRVRATPVEVRGSTRLPEAYVYLLLGQRDSAIARLDALVRGAPHRRMFYLNYPWMRGLRGDPRVERLAR